MMLERSTQLAPVLVPRNTEPGEWLLRRRECVRLAISPLRWALGALSVAPRRRSQTAGAAPSMPLLAGFRRSPPLAPLPRGAIGAGVERPKPARYSRHALGCVAR